MLEFYHTEPLRRGFQDLQVLLLYCYIIFFRILLRADLEAMGRKQKKLLKRVR